MPNSIDSPDTFYAPWEKTFGRILTPFEEFIHRQTAGGIVLIACTIAFSSNKTWGISFNLRCSCIFFLFARSWFSSH